jgi:hypothetical protein
VATDHPAKKTLATRSALEPLPLTQNRVIRLR